MESTQEGTHSIENLRSRRHNDDDDPNSQIENPSPVQKRTSRRGGRGQRGRGSRRGRVGRGRQQELDEEDRQFLPIINCELLIQLVEARPALWDQTDPKHSDHNTTRRQWQEVYANLVPTWNDLSRQAKKNCGTLISFLLLNHLVLEDLIVMFLVGRIVK
ncbi:uncharacterized protein LOC122935934 isoform X2 [Bufo gargarizans]|uniref:uncharacterized protein LOC122935934 isoform X2 n=1 Tax=Bufo gargarizans TaxID=30331 RepID=UPI001CF514C0|nr:uncharacterized protein LOC122935934 isoform X2 [Bufo gargarizans]